MEKGTAAYYIKNQELSESVAIKYEGVFYVYTYSPWQ